MIVDLPHLFNENGENLRGKVIVIYGIYAGVGEYYRLGMGGRCLS